jgi:uncharacterized protein YecE (DUF72 family)
MIRVGTSGWQYPSWKGGFYPEGLPMRAWLRHYAGQFSVVEVNNSFYQLPREITFDRWHAETPDGFVFAVKASRYITHIRRLRDCKDSVDLFWSRANRLGSKLGPVLFQLPPTLRADPELLAEFLRILPRDMKPAFEFRHNSWRGDDVRALLDRSGAAWVLADRPGGRVTPVVTGGWSYVRFHQGQQSHPAYRRSKLRTWAGRLAKLPARETYVFFNNDELAAAPADAATLVALLGRT